MHTLHQVIRFGHAVRSNCFVLNQHMISSKGLSSGLMLEMLEDAVRVLSSFCFFIMSFSIQVSVAGSSRHIIGQNEIHIVFTNHIFQIVACGHAQPLYSSEKLHTGSYRQETKRNN
jgi:hypothetical protein